MPVGRTQPELITLKSVSGKSEPVNRYDLLNVDNKNWQDILCRRCDTVIFREDKVSIVENYKTALPAMSTGGKPTNEKDDVSLWWYTSNSFDFETIAFKKDMIDGKMVLLCGECEFGPVGLRDKEKNQHWLAAERVSYGDCPISRYSATPKVRKPKKYQK
ncbi:hypothetical protein Q1695_010333 [Nippostrongylus brasiliensis]|nr:hypothetical protein Q1695_010333 [Nippostrongylus brasiliensis]